jgi:pSer/pThr/pTyr-binding forkhead associated (FHA) protein
VSEGPFALHSATPAELKERLEADRRGVPYLIYRDEAGAQRFVELGSSLTRITVGRQRACDIPLPHDRSVSRVHAVLERIGNEWTVVDDGTSRNGSFVNNDRLHGRRRLCDGDIVRVGATDLAFRSASTGETSETGAAPAPSIAVSSAQRRVLVALCRPFVESPFAAAPSNSELARELIISVETVKSHMHFLFQAFKLDDVPQHRKRARLAQAALELGVVTPGELTPAGTADARRA